VGEVKTTLGGECKFDGFVPGQHRQRIIVAPRWWKRALRFVTFGLVVIPAKISGEIHASESMLLIDPEVWPNVRLMGTIHGV
jgi:hypothetical protein